MNHDVSLNAAILGFGRWGMNLHKASLKSKKIKISHACTRSPEKVKTYCDEHQIELTSDYAKVLESEHIGAIIVATPHTQHFDQIMQAADSRKHVFAEKPFTLSAQQARTALATLSDKGLKVAIGHNRRFAGNTLALKNLLEQRALGELLHVEGTFSASMSGARGRWRDSREESPAGGMTSLGIHVLDMFLNLAGPMRSVSATSERIRTTCDFDDSTIVQIEFENGARGVLTTLTSTSMQWRITVYGTKGWAEIREQDELWIQLDGEDMTRQTFEGFDYPALRSIQGGLDAFADDVAGRQPFPISPADILHTTTALDSVFQSAVAGGQKILLT
ncbi:MAG: Gfo/Idh/MocA family oxidoreductase [Pseudomonadota bacterium]